MYLDQIGVSSRHNFDLQSITGMIVWVGLYTFSWDNFFYCVSGLSKKLFAKSW